MTLAKLFFTSHKNSFSVHIENMEALHVQQIQEIESFVANRKGIMDFDTYTFVIQKRLEFHEFVKLVTKSGMQAECFEKQIIFARKSQIGFGQYKGLCYEDLPDSYMQWLKTNYRGQERATVDSELKKRGL